jgi:hypothetical protein
MTMELPPARITGAFLRPISIWTIQRPNKKIAPAKVDNVTKCLSELILSISPIMARYLDLNFVLFTIFPIYYSNSNIC